MAKKKRITKRFVESLLLQVIDDYNEKNEDGAPLDNRVKTTDYLRAVSMLSTMNGLDKPKEDTSAAEDLTYEL